MTIAIPELADSVGATAESTVNSVAGSASSGLSNVQKGLAGSKLFPKPRTHHPYIVGGTLIIVGVFGLIGSITGSLPSMLAALFVPPALTDYTGNSPVADILGQVENVVTAPVKIAQDIWSWL